jgi:hypothetical protein
MLLAALLSASISPWLSEPCPEVVDQSDIEAARMVFVGTPTAIHDPESRTVDIFVHSILKGDARELWPRGTYRIENAFLAEPPVSYWNEIVSANWHFADDFFSSQMHSGAIQVEPGSSECETYAVVQQNISYLFIVGERWIPRAIEPIADFARDPWVEYVGSSIEQSMDSD